MKNRSSQDLTAVKNIVFDLGGVILNIDYDLTRKSFERLGIRNFNEVYSQAKQDDLFNLFETGRISEAVFRDSLRTYLNKKVTDLEIDQAWNAMLLDLPLNRLALIKSLSAKKRVFLLSNTNSIHIRAFKAIVKSGPGLNYFEGLFEKIYYSHIIGKRKPDTEVFLHILDDAGLMAEETLFFDDSEQHVHGALRCGIQGILCKKDEIMNFFSKKDQAL